MPQVLHDVFDAGAELIENGACRVCWCGVCWCGGCWCGAVLVSFLCRVRGPKAEVI